MRILKKITRLFQRQTPDKSVPSPEFPASEGTSSKCEPEPGFNPGEVDNIFEELLNDAGFLISRLNYVGKNAREQEEKRMEAMRRLQALGPEAEGAVGALVPKLFGEKAQERQLALQTLESIDASWQQHEQVIGQIPFMLEKLNKGYPIGSKAIDILSAIGAPAVPFLQDALKPDSGRDDFFRSNALRCLSKMAPPAEALPAIIEATLKHSSSVQMAEAAAEAIGIHSDWATPNTPFLLAWLEKGNAALRSKVLQALSRSAAIDDAALPPLFGCLADENEEIRSGAINILAGNESDAANEFYEGVVAKQGELSEEDLKNAFERLQHVFIKSTVEDFRSSRMRFINNLSWYNLEFQQALDKPNLLLGSVLDILKQKEPARPDLAEHLMRIFEKQPGEAIQESCLALLGKIPENKEPVLAFLVNQLNQVSAPLRPIVVRTLEQLDPQWITHPAAVSFINNLIDGLDTSGRQADSAEALLAIGDAAAPLLVSRLEQSEQRVIQQTLLDILGKLGANAEINVATLLKIKERCANTHTLMALNALIGKLGKEE